MASSEVWYAASSTVHWYTATGTIAIKMTGTDNVTSHGVNLSSLTTSKTYYYVAISKDAAGNTATSSEQTFTTLTPPPPVSSWSNIQITNFSGNGNLYYGQQPAIAWSGNNYGVAWVGNDGIPGTQNIFFKKLDINGNPVGDHIKITDYVSSGAATAFAPNIIWNGSEYGIAWTANKGNGQNLYFATLDANGNTLTNIVLSVPNDNTTDARPGLKWTGASFAITWRGYDPYNMSITYRFYAEVATDGQALAVSKKIATDNEWNSVNINIFSGTVLSSGGKIYFSDTNVSQELVSTVAGSNSWPFITWNGVKYAIAWINVQNNQTQLYFGTK